MARLTHPVSGRTVHASDDLDEYMRARGWVDALEPAAVTPQRRSRAKHKTGGGASHGAGTNPADGDAADSGDADSDAGG